MNIAPALSLVLAFAPLAKAHAGKTAGPLRVDPKNPRYLSDRRAHPVFLTGSHTWGNLQDYRYSDRPSPPPLDVQAYLAFLQRHHHNFFRLWVWETAMNKGAQQSTIYYEPLPYQRPGKSYGDG